MSARQPASGNKASIAKCISVAVAVNHPAVSQGGARGTASLIHGW